jgi:glycosyltransferase involved in cell wall biosynthesis
MPGRIVAAISWSGSAIDNPAGKASLLKPRILHIIDTLQRSGTARQLSLLARCERGCEVHVCALSSDGQIGESLARNGIAIHVLGRRWFADAATFWRLARLVKELQPETIVGWQVAGRAYAAAVAKRNKSRLVAVWRDIPSPRGPLQRTTERYAARRADTVLAAFPAVCDHCTSLGIAAEKIQVVPSGTENAPPPVTTRGQIFHRLGLPESARLIGWVSRLEADRGGKDAIWAADLLKVIRDDAHLLIFGAGPHGDRLLRFREQVEIADKVHFLGNRGDLQEFLPHLDQFWSTRRTPGMPQAMLEAMAAGVPAVASEVAGTCDLIKHEATGFLFAAGHRAGLARWAEHLLNHPEVARQLGAAGRQRVESEFSAEKLVERWAAAVPSRIG